MAITLTQDLLADPTVRGALGRLGLGRPSATTVIASAHIEVPAPPDTVWETWHNLERWSTWSKPWISSARWLEKRDWEVGAKFEQTLDLGFPLGRLMSIETIREVNAHDSVSWWKSEAGLQSCHIWFFLPLNPERTKITYTGVFLGPRMLFAKPFVKGRWQKQVQDCVKGLARAVEMDLRH